MLLRMFLLVITSALSVLVGFTAALDGGSTCGQKIPAKLIRELWSRTTQLINKLPKQEKVSRRLLPKFCTRCPQQVIGWLEIKEMIDVYQRSVFSRDVIQRLLPLQYNELLNRLQHTLTQCDSSSKHSKWFKTFRKLERKLKKRRGEQFLKAIREFTFVLRWIDELALHHVL